MKFLLSKEDWLKIGKGALVAIVGALLTYFTTYFSGANFGQYTPIVVAVWSVIANICRKWLAENNTEVNTETK